MASSLSITSQRLKTRAGHGGPGEENQEAPGNYSVLDQGRSFVSRYHTSGNCTYCWNSPIGSCQNGKKIKIEKACRRAAPMSSCICTPVGTVSPVKKGKYTATPLFLALSLAYSKLIHDKYEYGVNRSSCRGRNPLLVFFLSSSLSIKTSHMRRNSASIYWLVPAYAFF